MQGRRNGFEGGGTISWRAERAKKSVKSLYFCLPGGHETEHFSVFIVAIMTTKSLPALNQKTL